MRRPHVSGFTLIELMIVVAVIAVLTMIALPSYTKYTFRARRAEGQELLLRTATAQERYYSTYNTYAGSLTTDLKFASDTSTNGYYKVTVAPLGGALTSGYVLTASAQLTQAGDACKNLTLDSNGTKSQTGTTTNGRCW
ncbi:type IV pilin protein [Luteibacter sp. CQ10]|uniref:type IV pilin protein n=1 Tax=Luteibacter sp. CQ10 TaxID=2805821 RepID=UPI0034A14093